MSFGHATRRAPASVTSRCRWASTEADRRVVPPVDRLDRIGVEVVQLPLVGQRAGPVRPRRRGRWRRGGAPRVRSRWPGRRRCGPASTGGPPRPRRRRRHGRRGPRSSSRRVRAPGCAAAQAAWPSAAAGGPGPTRRSRLRACCRGSSGTRAGRSSAGAPSTTGIRLRPGSGCTSVNDLAQLPRPSLPRRCRPRPSRVGTQVDVRGRGVVDRRGALVAARPDPGDR